MTKSSQHQASVKYFLKPYALILMIISQTKITVNTLSMYFRIIRSILRCGRFTSSIACITRTKHSVCVHCIVIHRSVTLRLHLMRAVRRRATPQHAA